MLKAPGRNGGAAVVASSEETVCGVVPGGSPEFSRNIAPKDIFKGQPRHERRQLNRDLKTHTYTGC